jgi:hypothetical protein
MIRTKGIDQRDPHKLQYFEYSLGAVSASIPDAALLKSHFRGTVVGLQVSASTVVAGGTLRVVITDDTTGVVLLDTGVVTVAMVNPYFQEFFASGVSYLPPSDSQLDQLALISQGDMIEMDVTVGGGLSVTNLVLTPEFMGRE